MDSVNASALNAQTMKYLIERLELRVRRFHKGETILRKDMKEERLCLLLKGTAYLCIDNEYADKQLLDFFLCGQLFYDALLPSPHNGHCFVQAKRPCTVAYLEWDRLRSASGNADDKLTSALSALLCSAAERRGAHCHMLQQKTIRGKLLAFLYDQASLQNSETIRVPIPYSDLADYLTIGRSSLMTELRKMQTERLIDKQAHTISLLPQNSNF